MAAQCTESREEFRFLLIGKPGSGKRTTGNTILGADLFDSDVSCEPVTSECTLKKSMTEQGMIEIMDSPGLFDTTKSHEEISALVMQAIARMHPGPDAIFYVIKIDRYTEEDFGVYKRLKALLDTSVTKYLIILFTHGDALKGKNMAQLLEKAPAQLKEVLKECDYRYVVMDNIHKEDRSQVEQLLHSVKQLQDKNGHKPYQCPKYTFVGDKMEEEVNKRMLEVEARKLQNKKHVQELSDNLKQTPKKGDKKMEVFQKELKRMKENEALQEKLKRMEKNEALREKLESMKKTEALQEKLKSRKECQQEQQMKELKKQTEQTEQPIQRSMVFIHSHQMIRETHSSGCAVM